MKGTQKDGIYKVCPCPQPAEGMEYDCTKRHGTYAVTVRLGTNPVTGQPVRFNKGGFPTRKDAQSAIAKKRLDYRAAEQHEIDGDITVGEWFDRWYAALEALENPPEKKTMQGYQTNIKVWKPLIGHLLLKELSRRHVETALEELAKERSDDQRPKGRHGQWKAKRGVSTLLRYRATLSAALTAAQLNEDVKALVPHNVARGKFGVLTESKTDKAVRAITPKMMWKPHETMDFFDHIVGHRYALLYSCYALTGTRRAEWLGARWSSLNDAETSLAVTTTVVPLAGLQECLIAECDGHVGRLFKPTPKSEASVRWLPLPDQLQEALAEHRRAQRRQAKEAEVWVDHDLIFPDVDGGPLDPNDVTETFQVLVASAGLPKLTGPHALRHMAVSMMLAEGTPVEEVAKITGHSATVLRKVYAHVIEEYARQSVQRYANKILGRSPLPGYGSEAAPALATVTRLAQR